MTLIIASGVSLVVGALLALGLPTNASRARAAIVTQLVASAFALAAVLPVVSSGVPLDAEWVWSFPIELVRLRVDAVSAFFLAWSLPMVLLGTIYAVGYLKPYFDSGRNGGWHYALLNLISLSLLMVFTVENAMAFLLGWEIAAVSAWLLAIWDYKNQKIRFAGFNYLVSTHVGMFVLVAAFMVLHSQTASMDFTAFAEFLHAPSPTRNVLFVLLATAFGLKSGFFPLHTWLPRAESAAPAHVAGLMSGVIHKAGLFGLLRFLLLMETPEAWMGWYLIGFSCLSALLGALYTSAQRDLKRMLGYSSTENVGIAGIGFGVGMLGLSWNEPTLVLLGFTGGILHILNHALFKCLLFYAAGAVYLSTRTVDIERLGGLARSMPRTAVLFLLGGLAISAVPPFNGFVSEFLLYSGLLGSAVPAGVPRVVFIGIAALLAFVGAVSALAITRAFGIAFLGHPRDSKVHVQSDLPAPLLTAMSFHAVGILVVGLWPPAGLWLVRSAVRRFLDLLPPSGAPLPDVTVTLFPIVRASALLAAVLVLLVLFGRWLQRRSATHVTWACGYGAPNTRMQYSGTSFSQQFATVFKAFLPQLRREELPHGYFPTTGKLSTHHVDAVERRMFAVLGDSESLVARIVGSIPDEPRFTFAAGLLALGVIAGFVVLGETP